MNQNQNQEINLSQIFRILIEDFRSSGIPANRLFYLNSIKKIIEIGESLNKLSPNDETQVRAKELREHIEDYKLYPKLNSQQ